MKKLILATLLFLASFVASATVWTTEEWFGTAVWTNWYVTPYPQNTLIAVRPQGETYYLVNPPYLYGGDPWIPNSSLNSEIQWAVTYARNNGIFFRWGSCAVEAGPYDCTLDWKYGPYEGRYDPWPRWWI